MSRFTTQLRIRAIGRWCIKSENALISSQHDHIYDKGCVKNSGIFHNFLHNSTTQHCKGYGGHEKVDFPSRNDYVWKIMRTQHCTGCGGKKDIRQSVAECRLGIFDYMNSVLIKWRPWSRFSCEKDAFSKSSNKYPWFGPKCAENRENF